MTMNDQLYAVFSHALGIPLEDVSDDLVYNSIPKWDSTAHLTLVAELEEAFDIMMDTDDIIDMSSVAKAKEILRKYDVMV